MESSPSDKPRFFFDHLKELRQMLVQSLIAITLGVCLAFWKSALLFQILEEPYRRTLAHFPQAETQVSALKTLVPIEAFMINMKLATAAGIVLASPFILWRIWVFVVPALKPSERVAILMVLTLGLGFFMGGVCFSYFLVIPMALQFLLQYNLDYQLIPLWTLQGYFDFTLNFSLVFGILFELPLVLAGLAGIGIATPQFLSQKRKHAILAIFILAAIVAPSADPVTQTIVAVPLILLYEVGIWLSWLVVKRKKNGTA
jgi:sec-independent protein translocase protein TatC